MSDQDLMTTVRLRNGSDEADGLVRVTMISLRDLAETNPIAFFEMVMICRNRVHRLFGNVGDLLKGRNLIEHDGQPHNSVRNVVLSAVVGDGLDMTLRSPCAQTGGAP
jgi:hypothetical protein